MRIATLNINGFGDRFGAWSERGPRISKYLLALAPDIVLLQAVARDPATGKDQSAQLARWAGYCQHEFRQAHAGAMGVGMLVRDSVGAVRAVPLAWEPGADDPQQRALLLAGAPWNGSALRIANAHFSWVPALNARHAEQARTILTSSTAHTLLAGDLNAPPDSASMRAFAEAGWVDAWAHAHPGEDGPTFPTDRPAARIDYFWMSPALAPSLQDIRTFGADPPLSDHLGLIATFAD